jgi:dolichol-phosphate mannosyltransferase
MGVFMPVLSVIMPAYNEQDTISDALKDVINHILPHASDLELIVVDDGSKDKTAEIVSTIGAKHPCVKLIRQANAGHGAALRKGIDEATGDWLLLLDSDCQIGLEDFAGHWQRRADFDVFLGVRFPRQDPGFRLVISKFMKYSLKILAGVTPVDAGAPYKLVSRKAWQTASTTIKPSSWIPSVLLAAYAVHDSSKLISVQEPIAHFARPHGESTLNARRLTRFCFAALAEILAFGRELRARKT